jgi:Domain of unknown function (DUF397)
MKWRKSSYSSDDGNCVEVARLDSHCAVRDSKDATGPALRFTTAEWLVFTTAIRDDEFD